MVYLGKRDYKELYKLIDPLPDIISSNTIMCKLCLPFSVFYAVYLG
jgi:hypothetical protein